jgi:type IV pilus assembly protein PilP
VLVGCTSEQEDINGWMVEQARGMRGGIPPLPAIMTFPVVDYDADEAVEPFFTGRIEPVRKPTDIGDTRIEDHQPEPLEAYPLESLHMVGVMSKAGATHALIRADKSLYQVRVGNYMGQDMGLITAIKEDTVELLEHVQDETGEWIPRTSSLLLQEAVK